MTTHSPLLMIRNAVDTLSRHGRAVHRNAFLALTLRVLGIGFGMVLWSACSAPPQADLPYQPSHDLVVELPYADLRSEVDGLVFGLPESRPYLTGGFAPNAFEERLQRPYVWGVGEASEIRWPILRPRDGTLDVELRPYRFPGAQPQTVEVFLNDTPLANLELRRGVTTYSLPIQATQQRRGDNRLRFRHGWWQRPSEVGGPVHDNRQLATAFFGLRWQKPSPAAGASPQVDLDTSRLFLPQGVGLDFFLKLSGPSRLWADSWIFRGASTQGSITLQEEGRPTVELASLERAPTGGWIDLPGDGERLVRMGVDVFAAGDSPSMDPELGLGLVRPRIESSASLDSSALSPSTLNPSKTSTASTAPAHLGTGAVPTERSTPPESATQRPDIFLLMIDTLRADHLGTYGYERPTSPHLDALADEALLFENAVAQSSWTRASVASMFTGLWPLAHGTNLRDEVLSDAAQTLPELLQAQGYRTAAFFSNPNISELFGFRQGFDHVLDFGKDDVDADVIHRHVLEWLDQQDDDTPLFLYVHTIDPHSPYDPPAEQRRRFAPQVDEGIAWTPARLPRAVRRRRAEATPEQMTEMIDLYDAEIAYADAAFGRFRDDLEQRSRFEPSWLIVVSDHGEEFLERGNLEHGKTLFGESLNVPFIVKPPGTPGVDFESRRIAERVQHIDLLPTLGRPAGLPHDPAWQGRDLTPLWQGSEPLKPVPIYSYLHLDGSPRLSLIDGPWKLILRQQDGQLVGPHLYHLVNDPGELEDLGEELPIRRRVMTRQLQERWMAPEGRLERATTELGEDLKRRLEALGYL